MEEKANKFCEATVCSWRSSHSTRPLFWRFCSSIAHKLQFLLLRIWIQPALIRLKYSQRDAQALSAMSLEELWHLFPITLVKHSDAWEKQYRRMERMLSVLLQPVGDVRIHHIGSTAIQGIVSKDIVDVLVEVSPEVSILDVSCVLEKCGFVQMSKTPSRISLNCGYTPRGYARKVFHVHLCTRGDNDELYFRDYLNDHPEVAREYGALKLELWKRHKCDRDAYTDAKAAFVHRWSKAGREAYPSRY